MATATATDMARIFARPITAGGPSRPATSTGGSVPQTSPMTGGPLPVTTPNFNPHPGPGVGTTPPPAPVIPRRSAPTFSPMNVDYSQNVGAAPHADPNSIQADPELLAILRERAGGGGMLGMEEFINAQANPLIAMMEREFGRQQDAAFNDLAGRGVLDSGETLDTVTDMRADLGERSAALRGQFGAQFEQMKQGNINSALDQLGDLEGSLIGARTAITTANIGAAAQVQSASIQAGATITAAQIQANASLQIAGMNYDIAIQNLDWDMASEGIDPDLFRTDPQYRDDMITWMAARERSRQNLMDAQAQGILSGMLP